MTLRPAGAGLNDAHKSVRKGSARSEPLSSFCLQVQVITQRTGAAMPTRLDEDTLALAATASGCDVVLRYGLTTLALEQIAPTGLAAMREQVVAQLCSEAQARGVMEHNGSFTSVYEDKSGRSIGQFRVALPDCQAVGGSLPVKTET